MSEPKFGKLKLLVQGTRNSTGFEILYGFEKGHDFLEFVAKKEFYFIQPWMQFPSKEYTDECMRVSIELVERFNNYERIKEKADRLETENTRLYERLRKMEEKAAINEACVYFDGHWPEEYEDAFCFRGELVTKSDFDAAVQGLKDLRSKGPVK